METQSQPSRLVVPIVTAGVLLVSLDLFIVNVALAPISRDLASRGLGAVSWVLNGYAIVYAALLVLFGRLADQHNRRSGFLLGVTVFVLASAACGAADSVGMLIAFRVVQAAGAALLTPTSLALVLAATAPERRHGAVRAWTAVGGIGAALGPVAGGLLVALSWRWVFLVNVPIGLAALAAGVRWLPSLPGHPGPRPDVRGAVLITGGVGALALGLVQGHTWGWGSPATVAVLAGATAALAAFVARCLRGVNPLVPPALFKARAFTGAAFVATVFSIAFGAMLLSIVLWEQTAWGWSPLRTGLAIAPGPAMVPVFAFLIAGRAIARWGPGPVAGAGATVYAAGAIWWSLAIGTHPDYLGGALPGMLMTGIGVGLTLPTYMATAAASLPPASFATGSAVVNMLRQIGLAIGVAVLVAVLGTPAGQLARLHAFEHGWVTIAALSLVSAVVGAAVLPGRARLAPDPRELSLQVE